MISSFKELIVHNFHTTTSVFITILVGYVIFTLALGAKRAYFDPFILIDPLILVTSKLSLTGSEYPSEPSGPPLFRSLTKPRLPHHPIAAHFHRSKFRRAIRHKKTIVISGGSTMIAQKKAEMIIPVRSGWSSSLFPGKTKP